MRSLVLFSILLFLSYSGPAGPRHLERHADSLLAVSFSSSEAPVDATVSTDPGESRPLRPGDAVNLPGNALRPEGTRADSSGEKADCHDAASGRALRKIIEQWKDGYNSGRTDAVAALYSEDAYYLTQHFTTGIVHGRPAIQAYFQRGVDARYQVDSITIVSMDCSGDVAYVITRYESTNGGQKAFGVNLVVLRNIDDRWLIVAHESAVPDPATTIQKLDTATPP